MLATPPHSHMFVGNMTGKAGLRYSFRLVLKQLRGDKTGSARFDVAFQLSTVAGATAEIFAAIAEFQRLAMPCRAILSYDGLMATGALQHLSGPV